MTGNGIISIVLILVNIAFSYRGFHNKAFFDGYKFEIDPILKAKDYKRLITSGFLHLTWWHLILNMVALYMFGYMTELVLGPLQFFIIYVVSLLGGNLLELFLHRNHGDYSSAGASGAVMGIIFAAIALFPGMTIWYFIPAWLFGLLYVLSTIYGIRTNNNDVGHEAHLGGGLVGMVTAVLMKPDVLIYNYFAILVILVPAIIFIYIAVKKPHILFIPNARGGSRKNHYSIDHDYNAEKARKARELDAVLEKIAKRGMGSLSKKELAILKEHSEAG